MTKEKIIDNLELYTVGRPKKDQVSITVEELQNLIDEIKTLNQPTSDDCISRQAVVKYIETCGAELGHYIENESVREDILNMPSVTPTQCIAEVKFSKEDLREICNERIEIECTHGTCKDCRWLTTDEDGNYYCRQTGYFDSLDFYCKDFEKRGGEDESIN